MKLHLHIDRLVLPPGSAADPERLAAAVREALRDMLDPACPEDILGPALATGGAVATAPAVTASPSPALPQTIARAVLTTLRGPA